MEPVCYTEKTCLPSQCLRHDLCVYTDKDLYPELGENIFFFLCFPTVNNSHEDSPPLLFFLSFEIRSSVACAGLEFKASLGHLMRSSHKK